MSAADAVSRAATRLALEQPFFGTLLAMTDLVADEGIPTLATNGERLYYNPEFLKGLSSLEAEGALVHELMHIIYLHCDPSRRGGRQARAWNAAGDYAINQELKDSGFHLPKDVLLDKRYAGLTAEGIYDLLPRQDEWACLDRLLPMPEQAREQMPGRILAAAAAQSGGLPDGVARWVKLLRSSRVPWRRVLRRFLRETLGREEQAFLPPSRRHLWDGRYLPSTKLGRKGRLVVAVDTSGSIDEGMLASFAAEIEALAPLCESLTVMTCDAKVHETVRLPEMSGWLAKIKFKGGGGTDFAPVFARADALKPPPDALVYLTDGQGVFPGRKPRGYPVLWALSAPAPVPWGTGVLLSRP